jgi:hypothetical protein
MGFWLSTSRPEINGSDNILATLIFIRVNGLNNVSLRDQTVVDRVQKWLTSRVLVCSIRIILPGIMYIASLSIFIISVNFASNAKIQGYNKAKL